MQNSTEEPSFIDLDSDSLPLFSFEGDFDGKVANDFLITTRILSQPVPGIARAVQLAVSLAEMRPNVGRVVIAARDGTSSIQAIRLLKCLQLLLRLKSKCTI